MDKITIPGLITPACVAAVMLREKIATVNYIVAYVEEGKSIVTEVRLQFEPNDSTQLWFEALTSDKEKMYKFIRRFRVRMIFHDISFGLKSYT